MALYVFRIADGSLVSWCPQDSDPVASDAQLAANGLTKVVGLPPLDATHAWDATNRTVAMITPLLVPNWIPTYEFVLLFTAAENAAIRASVDTTVQHFLFALTCSQQIDLNSATVQGGVAYLVAVGLLTQSNATLILSAQPSQ